MPRLIIESGAITSDFDITKKNLLTCVMNLFPDGIGDSVFIINGEIVDLNTFDIDREFDCDVRVVNPPKGFVEIIIAVVISVAASALLAPSIPTQQETEATQDSPNNSFSGQRNVIRLDEQEPNIYGNVISYPDLVVGEGGAWEYVDNQKIVKEVFLIGIQEYEINSEPKFEDTPFSLISGQSYEIYNPNEIVPVVQGQFPSELVDGQTISGPNSDDVQDGVTANGASSPSLEVTGSGTVLTVLNVEPDTNWDQIYALSNDGEVPVRVRFTYSYYALNNDPVPACVPFQETRTGTMTITLNGSVYDVEIDGIIDGESDCSDPTEGSYVNSITVTQLIGASFTVNLPIYTPQVQFSFDFRSGLRGSANIQVTIGATSGTDIVNLYTYSDDTGRQLFFTEKVDVSSLSGQLFVTFIRINDEKEDGSDRAQLSQVATNQYRSDVNYGDRTILTTERVATSSALSLRDSKINIDVTRKTITYDSDSGEIIETTSASRSFADAMLHEYVIVNGLPSSDLPLDDMYEIAERIGDFGNFDSTFADKEQDLNQKLKVMANVARCFFNFTGSEWMIYRDEAGLPVAQFDSRNISADSSEEVSYRGFQEASNDGIKLKYKNPTTNKPDYIYYVIQSGQSVRCIYSDAGLYNPSAPRFPIEIDLTGCYTESQAINRADLECRKLIYIQETASIKTLIDGDNIDKGQIVKYADYYYEDIANGEIKSINGNVYTSHNEIDLDLGTYYVTYTDEYGSVSSPIQAELISSTEFVSTLPDAYIGDNFFIQCGSRFIISSLDEQENTLYRVNDKILNRDSTVNLELVEYDERIYPEND